MTANEEPNQTALDNSNGRQVISHAKQLRQTDSAIQLSAQAVIVWRWTSLSRAYNYRHFLFRLSFFASLKGIRLIFFRKSQASRAEVRQE